MEAAFPFGRGDVRADGTRAPRPLDGVFDDVLVANRAFHRHEVGGGHRCHGHRPACRPLHRIHSVGRAIMHQTVPDACCLVGREIGVPTVAAPSRPTWRPRSLSVAATCVRMERVLRDRWMACSMTS